MSLLYIGWDKHYGFQLYQSDPSGNYGGWKATCIGNNSAVGIVLHINSACWVIFHLRIFFKITFKINSYENTIRVSTRLDTDQDRHFVGPDLRPNCLQRLSADDKSRPW